MATLIDKTIAVLPFVNISNSEENEYFCDGITEEIINALAKIEALKVTSRTSSFFYKNKNIPMPNIGKELGVSTLLEGSVRLSKNRIRITAQLIEAHDDFHFWSETWDRKLDDLFEVQDEVSLAIADKLREQLGHFEIKESLVSKQTDSLMAYEHSLRANYYRNKWNPNDIKKAIQLYEKGLTFDPEHGESYVGLADCYSFMATTGFMPHQEAWAKSSSYTDKALRLNKSLSGVHYQLSNRAFFTECDYGKSLKEMKKAITINPNNAEAHQFMSFLYIVASHTTQAKKHLDIALHLNPLSEETRFFNAYFHYMLEDYTKALGLLNACLEANDKNIPAHAVKTQCFLQLGQFDKVIGYFDTMPQDVVIPAEKTGTICLAYALKKDQTNTDKYLKELEEQATGPNGFTADAYRFMTYALTNELDKAFAWIAESQKNNSSLVLLKFGDPLVKALKTDARYAKFKDELFAHDDAPPKSSKKKNLLSTKESNAYKQRLLGYVHDEKPYLQSNLSLRVLAEQIDIHPNQLSWLLNEELGKNFNEFINAYRIQHFKTLVQDPKNAHVTLLGLAFDSGFNSKTVFNTYFKKETGFTPRQFLNSISS